MKLFSYFLLVIVMAVFQPFGGYAQFYVAPDGNDMNSGLSPAHAFATLNAAQAAMRSSKIKTTYIRKGTYFPYQRSIDIFGKGNKLKFGLILDSADAGETWSYYPPDGYNTAILDGRSTGPDSGTGVMVMIKCKRITWNGIQIQNYIWNGIFINHSDSTAITNSIIHDGTYNMTGHNKNQSGAGAILAVQSPDLLISNNVIYHIAFCGILVGSTSPGGNISNTIIQNNVVLNTMIGWEDKVPIKDGGAIYLIDRLHSSNNIIIRNNFISNYGNSTNWSKGLYFDDGASNIVATGNIITGTGEYAIQYHEGYNIVVTGNIIDIGDCGNHFIAYYQAAGISWSAMQGNVFAHNIVIASSSNGGKGWSIDRVDSLPNIKDNVYYNYAGKLIVTRGNELKQDKTSIYENPLICGYLYFINPNSPVYRSPVNFPPIVGRWGPPGYVIPAQAVTASCPACK